MEMKLVISSHYIGCRHVERCDSFAFALPKPTTKQHGSCRMHVHHYYRNFYGGGRFLFLEVGINRLTEAGVLHLPVIVNDLKKKKTG
jgi:hypothetical protein